MTSSEKFPFTFQTVSHTYKPFQLAAKRVVFERNIACWAKLSARKGVSNFSNGVFLHRLLVLSVEQKRVGWPQNAQPHPPTLLPLL